MHRALVRIEPGLIESVPVALAGIKETTIEEGASILGSVSVRQRRDSVLRASVGNVGPDHSGACCYVDVERLEFVVDNCNAGLRHSVDWARRKADYR